MPRRRRRARPSGLLALILVLTVLVAVTHGWILVPLGLGSLLYAGRRRKLRLRRARPVPQVGARPPIPPAVKAAVWLRCGGRCQHCGITDAEAMVRTGKHLHYDHITPRSWGGPDTEDNLQLLCETCNLRKGARYAG